MAGLKSPEVADNENRHRLAGWPWWKIAALTVAFAFVLRLWTLQVDFSAPTVEGQISDDIALLHAENQQLRESQAALLDTVYFGLGTVLAIGALLIGYSWFQNREVLERYRTELRDTQSEIERRVQSSENRQRSSLKRTRRDVRRHAETISTLEISQDNLTRMTEMTVQRLDLLSQHFTLANASAAIDQLRIAQNQGDANAMLRHAITLLGSFNAPTEMRQFFADVAVDGISKALAQYDAQQGAPFLPFVDQIITLIEHAPPTSLVFLRADVIERLKAIKRELESDTEAPENDAHPDDLDDG